MSKPTLVLWDSSNSNITPAPTAGQIAAGWALNAEPASSHFNYLFKNVTDWCQYVSRTTIGEGGIADDLSFIGSNLLASNNIWTGTNSFALGLTANKSTGVTISGTTSTGVGVQGTASTSGGGVEGVSSTGIGVEGSSSSGTGVEGSSSSGTGVRGLASAPWMSGVYGYCSGTNGLGVSGEAANGTGVKGSGGIGVEGVGTGIALKGSGGDYGAFVTGAVAGVDATCTGGYGVKGVSTRDTDATDNYGVYGAANGGGTGARVGVFGEGKQYGVRGHCSGGGYGGYFDGDGGVWASSGSTFRNGVYGACTSSAAGVYGESAAGVGVYGTGATFGVQGFCAVTGLYGSGGTRGVYGNGSTYGIDGFSSAGSGVFGSSTTGHGGEFSGNTTKSALRLVPQEIPSSSVEGQMYYSSTTHTLRVCTDTGWHTVAFSD